MSTKKRRLLGVASPHGNRPCPGRVVIYPKDVRLITKKGYAYTRKLMLEIRASLGKLDHHLISIPEFCEYTKLDETEVRKIINT